MRTGHFGVRSVSLAALEFSSSCGISALTVTAILFGLQPLKACRACSSRSVVRAPQLGMSTIACHSG